MIRFLDGKTELKGGSKQDRLAAQEWTSLFWHEVVVGDALDGGVEIVIDMKLAAGNLENGYGRKEN